MRIAVPVDENMKLYKKNPFTAEKFAIFHLVLGAKVIISKEVVVENPLANIYTQFEQDSKECNCSKHSDLKHIYEHYAVLDVLGTITYLLASVHCPNMKRAMKNVGIKIYKIPPIINDLDTAIKNFLIGASYANTTQQICYAS